MRNWRPVPKHLNIYEYDTKYGKKYGVRKRFVDDHGKYNEFVRSVFKTWRDADIVLKNFENASNANSANPFVGERKLLDDVFEEMVKFKVDTNFWKEGSRKNAINYYGRYIKDRFGRTQIGKINRLEYERFLSSLPEKNLAHSTIRTINSVMQTTINFAVTNDWLMKNRLQHPVMPDGRNAKNKTIEPAEYKLWLKIAEEKLSKYEFAIILLTTLGARRGEVMGIRLKDLVFKGDTCEISWEINRTADEPLGTTLKTKSSYRKNIVIGTIVDYLKYMVAYSKK